MSLYSAFIIKRILTNNRQESRMWYYKLNQMALKVYNESNAELAIYQIL